MAYCKLLHSLVFMSGFNLLAPICTALSQLSLMTLRDVSDHRMSARKSRHCLINCVHYLKTVVPVFNKPRVVPAWEPDRISHRQRPQDRQLIQHLADKTERHVEI